MNAPHMCPGCFARPAAHGEQLCRVCAADYAAATATIRVAVERANAAPADFVADLRRAMARELGR